MSQVGGEGGDNNISNQVPDVSSSPLPVVEPQQHRHTTASILLLQHTTALVKRVRCADHLHLRDTERTAAPVSVDLVLLGVKSLETLWMTLSPRVLLRDRQNEVRNIWSDPTAPLQCVVVDSALPAC